MNGAKLAALDPHLHAALYAIIEGAEPIQSDPNVSLRLAAGIRFHGEWDDSLQSTSRFRDILIGVGRSSEFFRRRVHCRASAHIVGC